MLWLYLRVFFADFLYRGKLYIIVFTEEYTRLLLAGNFILKYKEGTAQDRKTLEQVKRRKCHWLVKLVNIYCSTKYG